MVPNLFRQVDRFFDPTLYDTHDLSGILTSQVPFVRTYGRPALNALGQPIQSPVFGMFQSKRSEDPLVTTLADHNAWPTLPERNQTQVDGVPLTDAEFYTYNLARGNWLTQQLTGPDLANNLDQIQANGGTKAVRTAMAINDKAADEAAATAVRKTRGWQ